MENTLYFGDNLEILKEYIPDNSIDLIYLDPPFNSKKDYNILYQEPDGKIYLLQNEIGQYCKRNSPLLQQ